MSELKHQLDRASERFDLEPEALDRFFRRRERRERRQRIAAMCLALGVVAAGAFIAVRALTGGGDPIPTAPKTDEELLLELAGTYTVTLEDSAPAVRANDIAGEYTMRLLPNGVIELAAPEGFVEGRAPSGITFRISGDEFTTNAFVNATCPGTVGVYRWTLNGNELSFESIREPCGLRQTLVASEPWERQA